MSKAPKGKSGNEAPASGGTNGGNGSGNPVLDAQQEALFREVDEDLRHELITKLWKAYGKFVIAAAVLVVVAVAGYQGWMAWQRSVSEQQAAAYEAAVRDLDAGNKDQALGQLAAIADSGETGFADLAALRRAAALAKDGDRAAAAQAYDALAADTKADTDFRNLATLLGVLVRLDGGAGIDVTDGELMGRLEPLAAPDSPWRHSALEMQGLLAMRDGDQAKARDLFNALAQDVQAPRGVRERAGELLAKLGGMPNAAPAPESNGNS